MPNEEPYRIEREGSRVVLRTTSFRTERGSVLHSGIFNRELAASFAAAGVLIMISLFVAVSFTVTKVYFLAGLVLFPILFMVFRMYVFREAVLETVFDQREGTIMVLLKRTIGMSGRSYPMDELRGITVGHISFRSGSPDAVEFIEKISAQHGTVIPGFGKKEDLYTAELDFGREKRVIFSSAEERVTGSLIAELTSALSGLPREASGA